MANFGTKMAILGPKTAILGPSVAPRQNAQKDAVFSGKISDFAQNDEK